MRKLIRDTGGSVMVEVAVTITLTLVFLLGTVDFLFAFQQWNRAIKAAERGARIAAVSAPVDAGLKSLDGLDTGFTPGDPLPAGYYDILCDGATQSCTGTRAGTYSATAMQWIVYGRGDQSCTGATGPYRIGMCDIFPAIGPANVRVAYRQTGLGFVGRPDGPVPTVTITLQNLTFDFFFLNGLLGFGRIQMPAITVTVTGEDLSSVAPASS
ncbi:TadE/TadG family type IV pilus assembly protein [Chelatococcus sp. SYSU_G07232]|uniref:TadE/TadG family type IV pilus assembly protein n=1 Tax=Chelatococcus albus TaxID=3047466 RepID=A0ABT7AIL7_9HYPH|nr:TadE/TadG family type IV pilus assembly protein [Chelatococcus sp. SYSU_G07232]MDJ1159214.1 TadE/TadG family type IV pilus assembly protein [Chelatococcus sp. SYSU_G07232]